MTEQQKAIKRAEELVRDVLAVDKNQKKVSPATIRNIARNVVKDLPRSERKRA